MPKGVSAERGPGYDIESIDADGNLFFIEVKGRVDGADTVTLTINVVNTGRNAPHRFRLALVSMEGDRAWPPVYGSGVDWGLPGFGDTQITMNLPGHGDLAANCRALAYRLYNHCVKTKQAEEARSSNGLVIACPELERQASHHHAHHCR